MILYVKNVFARLKWWDEKMAAISLLLMATKVKESNGTVVGVEKRKFVFVE